MSEHGSYTTVDGRPAVRFERRLAQPVEAVWRAVTEPGELHHWFPADVTYEPRVGATVRFTFAPGEVTEGEVRELDPPRVFGFSWGDDLLRIELEPDGDGTRLTLLHVLAEQDEDAAARTAAGWHLCLDALAQRVAGTPGVERPEGPGPAWRARYDEYVARGVPAGAPIPGLDEAPAS